MYYIGQKVRCVNDHFHGSIVEWGDQIPRSGEVYTVRKILQAPDHQTGVQGLAFHLVELVNPKTPSGGEVCFSVWRFVPLELEAEAEEAIQESAVTPQETV